MLLLFFMYLVVRQIGQVIFYLKFILDLILMLIIAKSFTWRLTYVLLHLLERSWMYLVCPVCCWVTAGSICLYVLKWFLPGYGKFEILQRHISLWILSKVLQCQQSFIRRIKSFKILNNRIIFKDRQDFTMTNNMASSGLWKIVYFPIFILTTDGNIGCVMSNIWSQMVWNQLLMQDHMHLQCYDLLT